MKNAKRLFPLFVLAIIIINSGVCFAVSSALYADNDKLWEWLVYPQYTYATPFEQGFATVSYGEPVISPNGKFEN